MFARKIAKFIMWWVEKMTKNLWGLNKNNKLYESCKNSLRKIILEHNQVIQPIKCPEFLLRMQSSCWRIFFSRTMRSFWLVKTLKRGVSETLRCVTLCIPTPPHTQINEKLCVYYFKSHWIFARFTYFYFFTCSVTW